MKHTYDKTLKIGDIVSSYFKGSWEIIDIQSRRDYHPIAVLKKIATKNGLPCKAVIRECDISYCVKEPLTRLLYIYKEQSNRGIIK